MRKHNYLIGFEGEGQVAYGKDDEKAYWVELLTYKEAKKELSKLLAAHPRRRIYKLVGVK